jgi:hypothetical protein
MKIPQTILSICLLIGTATYLSCKNKSGEKTGSDTVSYNFDIRPILSDKCFKCHGPDANKREAGLRLDIEENAFAALKETKGAFALVAGKPDASELFKRISSTEPSFMMPPPDSHLGVITPTEIELFRKWIKQGAKYERHWAFTAPKKTAVPKPIHAEWGKNEIDNFIDAKLDQHGLEPNKEADKERLLRRLSLDITGLPPTIEMQEKFLAATDSKAYENMVDTLLQTPQYGEKMAVHWLDVARYADSYGYQDDNIRTQWPWRDWLIHAFNQNLPYDQFVIWQLAGDMLPNATKEQMLATAFLRNHKYTEEGGVIPEEYRIEYLVDKTKTYTKGILGVTLECAQCHDHKYDPFTQKDYFSTLAFFNNSKEVGYEGDVSTSQPAKNPVLTLTNEDAKSIMNFISWQDTNQLRVSVMGELDTYRKTYLLKRGQYNLPDSSEEIIPNPLPSVLAFDTSRFARNRLGLAQWTVDKKNPLTARVFVNQIWQEFFGRGLVKTTGDYGMQGELPSHPELLDWLAVDFMENNWDIKRLIKKIVTSATYRQSAVVSKKSLEVDPENVYLSHAPRIRLKAEFIRDVVLGSSGLLNPAIGGPSVKSYQPSGLWEAASSGRGVLATYKQDHGPALYRRGVYMFIKLTVPPPYMTMFDASNRDQCEVKRSKTNTPIQALVMLNDPTVLEASRVLAQKLVASNLAPDKAISTAFRQIICRSISDKEMNILNDYYQQQYQQFTSKKLDAALTLNVGEYKQDDKVDKNKSAALMKVIVTIYNMEEAITKT